MAAEKPAYCEIEAFEWTPLAECLKGVFGTCRSESARRWLIRRYADLVELYKDYERKYRHVSQGGTQPIAGCGCRGIVRKVIVLPVHSAEEFWLSMQAGPEAGTSALTLAALATILSAVAARHADTEAVMAAKSSISFVL